MIFETDCYLYRTGWWAVPRTGVVPHGCLINTSFSQSGRACAWSRKSIDTIKIHALEPQAVLARGFNSRIGFFHQPLQHPRLP